MSRTALLVPALALAVAVAGCSKSDAGAANGDASPYTAGKADESAEPAGDDSADGPSKAVAAIDPCTLLTREEIIGQLELAQEPNQLAAFRANGGTWEITPAAEQAGISKQCNYAFVGNRPDGNFIHKSDFKLIVTAGAFVNPNVNDAKTRPIPGIGDEAYFMSRGKMMPYARVGDVAVGLEGFPNSERATWGTELLRSAVARLKSR
jgi:hypothetical protein